MNEKKFLWVEEYAPSTIDDCILPDDLKKQFNQLVEEGELPNMLFNGDAGVGKTTVAKVLCEMLNIDMMFMNASNERGIDEVRNKINTFASTTSLYGGYKVLLLDEADNLTQDAQKALRALIEQYQNNCRFILIADFRYKLIDPLRSRLQEYNFTYPQDSKSLKNSFMKRMLSILKNEEISMVKEDVPAMMDLVGMYYPNWRKVIHQLQRCCSGGKFDREIIDTLKGEHISTLFELMKVKNFTKVREWVAEGLASGVQDSDIIRSIYTEMKNHMVPNSLPECVLILADYQQKAAVVANQEINTVSMCVEIMMRCEFK